ncbi:S41 family peptidase [Spirulina sp. CS-785/01]|uniref:carboxyl-terminal processing protease CtpC n=1 Tax=Spirulina sp. CS-785/01 TaxID=3021716 RepID=UPI0023307F11|nr:carboxyl-terminal processing protease CtpC [Spirulina sp. CS-785/01]MDB9311766.1 S41 family peptidase [Spirulina sp. CS-785/01]
MVFNTRGLILGATAVAVTTVAVTGAGLHLSKSQAFFSDSPKELIDEVWQIIDRQYVDATFNQVDWRAVRSEYLEDRNYENRQEAYEAIREMLKELEDPYTRFMNPEEFQNMQIDTSGELTGVGIQIAEDEETDRLIVVSPIEDSPAYDAGILAKDIIHKIDGQDTVGMDVNEAVQLIRGEEGSEVTLTIKRGEQEIDYPITRAKIEIHPVKARIENTDLGSVGYIRLNQFNANAAKDMREAIAEQEEENVVGYILDLRSNPGGLLYASIEIARMWLEDGTIVSTVDRQGEVDRQVANSRAITDKPLVVLIDGGSASASEILSGALQDNERATLVGTQTFGKGLVQSVRPLADGSGLAVTIAKYLTPSGRDINKEGITPDIIFELSEDQRKQLQTNNSEIGTMDDPQFAKAIEVLSKEVMAQDGVEGVQVEAEAISPNSHEAIPSTISN